jgi:hypothetical protein
MQEKDDSHSMCRGLLLWGRSDMVVDVPRGVGRLVSWRIDVSEGVVMDVGEKDVTITLRRVDDRRVDERELLLRWVLIAGCLKSEWD